MSAFYPPAAVPLVPLRAAALRGQLQARALERAHTLNLRYELTGGRSPGLIFGPSLDQAGRATHGNFHPQSYRAICDRPDWARRLRKAHTGSLGARPRADWRWCELDCASSSDALLMNIFCHPSTLADGRVQALLGVDRRVSPAFGVKPRVPLARGLVDATEVDLQLGSLLLEAKLTESGFQTARTALVERFRDLEQVFALDLLPRTRPVILGAQWDEEQAARIAVERGPAGHFASYQLIRGALAAHSTGSAFCVLLDGRRRDLIEAWYRVLQAVCHAELRCRLQLLTWQELAGVLAADLQEFLAAKYGIVAC